MGRYDENKGKARTLVQRWLNTASGLYIPDCAQGMLSDSDDRIRLLEKAVKDPVAKQQIP